jgi:hypothetical protein
MAAGLGGCSSDAPSPSEPQQPGTLPVGTEKLSIDGRDAGIDDSLSCVTDGKATTFSTGDEQAGSTTVMSSGTSAKFSIQAAC